MGTENCKSAPERWVINRSPMGVVSGAQCVALTGEVAKYRLAEGMYKEFLQA